MTTRKPVLLIDQDDVLAEYIKEVTKRFNERFDEEYDPADCVEWNLVTIFGENILEVMHEPDIFLALEPVKDALETFRRLYESGLFEMYIVTAAKPCAVLPKHEWICQYMPFLPERNVIICLDKQMIRGDYLLDDGMHNIEAFDKTEGQPVVFNRPHNMNLPGDYPRVNNWLEFEQYIIEACYPELVESYFEQWDREGTYN